MADPGGKVEQKNINSLMKPLINEYNNSRVKKTNDVRGTKIPYNTKIDDDVPQN